MFIIFFKIWEGLSFTDGRGAWMEGQIPKEGVVVKGLRTTGSMEATSLHCDFLVTEPAATTTITHYLS